MGSLPKSILLDSELGTPEIWEPGVHVIILIRD